MSSSDVEMKGGHPPAGGVLQHSQRYGVHVVNSTRHCMAHGFATCHIIVPICYVHHCIHIR